MTDLNELADRVEVATGADRELDCLIYAAINPSHLAIKNMPGRFHDPDLLSALAAEKFITRATYVAPRYTASIDAAMTLADGFVLLHLSDIGADGLPLCRLGNPSTTPARQYVGIAHTLPRALCAAALRARAATPVQVDEVVG